MKQFKFLFCDFVQGFSTTNYEHKLCSEFAEVMLHEATHVRQNVRTETEALREMRTLKPKVHEQRCSYINN
jgi:hypothetical protein